MTSPEGNKSNDQPDLGKAAKDFWAAAKAKAKEVGGKTAEKAKDLGAKAIQEAKHVQDTSQPGKAPTNPSSSLKDKALDVWRRAPTLVVVSGLGLLLLCSSCCICGGLLSGFTGSVGRSGSAVRTGSSDSKGDPTEAYGKFNHLRSYEDTPPIVADWTSKGCTVYELTNWERTKTSASASAHETLYLVLDGGKLVRVYLKNKTMLDGELDEVAQPNWHELAMHKEPQKPKGTMEWWYIYDQKSNSLDFRVSASPGWVHQESLLRVNLRLAGDHGRWDGSETVTQTSKKNPPSFPEQREVKKVRGGDVRVHRP